MTKTTVAGLVGAALAGLFVAGCGHARVVNRTQYGGTLALEGDRNKAMEDAQRLMSDHCRGPYTVTEEGEAVIGTDTAHSEESGVTKEGTVRTEAGTSTRQATEWRVSYVCGTQAPAPGPAPGAPEGEGEGEPPPPPPGSY